MKFKSKIFYILIFVHLCFLSQVFSQKAIVFGTISDTSGKKLELVNIAISGKPKGTISNKNGYYEIEIPANKKVELAFSFMGYTKVSKKIFSQSGDKTELNIQLTPSVNNLEAFEVKTTKESHTTFTQIEAKDIKLIPSLNGNIESIVKMMPGVSSSNELSSQYSVRGGNYDENLVYVNDIEIYRPFLVRSGQQEGLSFVNSDLISSISFSSGGFDAKYGDKMSSVLDITYKKPTKFGGSVSGSLLGAQLHLEGATKNNKFSYLLGVRQKSNQYILKGMQTKGDYKPSFSDVQVFLNYEPSKTFEISYLGNYSRNVFQFIPQTRETDFGTFQSLKRLTIYFDGQEVDKFNTFTSAVSLAYKPKSNLKLKLISSVFNSVEKESFDIQGQYWLGDVEINPGQNDFGQVVFNRGIGTFLNHARNNLDATVYNIEHKGMYFNGIRKWLWGIKLQQELINSKIDEWQMIDSAGYSIPYNTNGQITLQNLIKSKVELSNRRYSGYFQHSWDWKTDSTNFVITAGVRSSYWELNEEITFSPRATIAYKPNIKQDIMFRFSGGYYYQPPFFHELKDFYGNLNYNIVSQQSIHIVTGADWNFILWKRPFKLTSELYYKILSNLIPYKVDNLRIRYLGDNNAKGYATGIDFKLNGEFVPGAESWASISFMKSEEDIKDDFYYKNGERIEPGYLPRPSDQRFMMNIFFQDYLPKFPTYKVHINVVYGSSLKFGPPGTDRYKDKFSMPAYKRVDIGFSKELYNKETTLSKRKIPLKNAWISLEVFNLLQIKNVMSYLWIKDNYNNYYAVPNYLTNRQFNLKINVSF